jgi:hypothetical protein
MNDPPSIVVFLPDGLPLVDPASEASASGDAHQLLEREQTDHSADPVST